MGKNEEQKESTRFPDKAAFGFYHPLSFLLAPFSSGGAGASQGGWDGLEKDFQIEPSVFSLLVQNFINTVSSRPKGEILAALADSKISRYARNDKYVTEFMKRST